MALYNEAGNFCFVASLRIQDIHEMEVIELIAILRRLQLCATKDMEHLNVESDCLLMVQECNTTGPPSSRLGILVEEICKLRDCFRTCTIAHVFWEHNVLAHTFARHAWQVQDVIIWETIPNSASAAFWLDSDCNSPTME